MSDLVVIVPSRGRPKAAAELIDAADDTCTADTEIVFAVDEDDPAIDDYIDVVQSRGTAAVGIVEQPTNMVHALNRAAWAVLSTFMPPPFALGFMGDDHRPRTAGWDTQYLQALRELGTGIVYGDDLFQGERLPTQVAMTTDIVRALQYMAPPTLQHMYVDNFWRDLGTAADCLRYLPNVVVEHMHPLAEKGNWDEGYARVNTPTMYAVDRQAYETHRTGRLSFEAEVVRGLRQVRG